MGVERLFPGSALRRGPGKVCRNFLAGRVEMFMALCFPNAVYGLAQGYRGVASLHARLVTALFFLRSRILDGSVFTIIHISCSTNIVRRA